ncbi:MAG: hypothetical protein R3B07_00040 [Polyangiaceae bacterium]
MLEQRRFGWGLVVLFVVSGLLKWLVHQHKQDRYAEQREMLEALREVPEVPPAPELEFAEWTTPAPALSPERPLVTRMCDALGFECVEERQHLF